MRNKKVLLLLVILISTPFLFAYNIVNTSEAVLLFFPRRVLYDQAAAIELSEAKTASTSDFYEGSYPSLDFNSSSPELALFRLYDTLDNMYSQVPAYNNNLGSTYLDYHGNDAIVTIHTTGIFVKVDNASITRDFSLTAFCTKTKIHNDGSGYYPEDATISQLGENTNPYFRRSGSTYTLYIPDTPPVSFGNQYAYKFYPYYQYLFDICLSLDQSVDNLEEGLYQTTITITSTSFRNNKLTEYVARDDKPIKQETGDPTTLSETFIVYGYFSSDGTNPNESNNQTYTFVVNPSTDTYSMDLAPTRVSTANNQNLKEYDDYYAVANLNFSALKVEQSSRTANPETAYKIYISPTNNYMSGGTDFKFNKTGTSSKTISYDLFVGTGSSYTSFSVSGGFNSSAYSSSSVAGSGGQDSNGYYILPKYSYSTNTHNGVTKYTETWHISDLTIYLKVKNEDAAGTIVNSDDNGEYQSYLYFTVVVR